MPACDLWLSTLPWFLYYSVAPLVDIRIARRNPHADSDKLCSLSWSGSFGMNVALMAGLPAALVDRARDKVARMHSNQHLA